MTLKLPGQANVRVLIFPIFIRADEKIQSDCWVTSVLIWPKSHHIAMLLSGGGPSVALKLLDDAGRSHSSDPTPETHARNPRRVDLVHWDDAGEASNPAIPDECDHRTEGHKHVNTIRLITSDGYAISTGMLMGWASEGFRKRWVPIAVSVHVNSFVPALISHELPRLGSIVNDMCEAEAATDDELEDYGIPDNITCTKAEALYLLRDLSVMVEADSSLRVWLWKRNLKIWTGRYMTDHNLNCLLCIINTLGFENAKDQWVDYWAVLDCFFSWV